MRNYKLAITNYKLRAAGHEFSIYNLSFIIALLLLALSLIFPAGAMASGINPPGINPAAVAITGGTMSGVPISVWDGAVLIKEPTAAQIATICTANGVPSPCCSGAGTGSCTGSTLGWTLLNQPSTQTLLLNPPLATPPSVYAVGGTYAVTNNPSGIGTGSTITTQLATNTSMNAWTAGALGAVTTTTSNANHQQFIDTITGLTAGNVYVFSMTPTFTGGTGCAISVTTGTQIGSAPTLVTTTAGSLTFVATGTSAVITFDSGTSNVTAFTCPAPIVMLVPWITLTYPGTYLINTGARLDASSGAVTTNVVTFQLYRTNNTPGAVSNCLQAMNMVAPGTQTFELVNLPWIYYTANAGDQLIIQVGSATSMTNISVPSMSIFADRRF